jgi:hypothetical protein
MTLPARERVDDSQAGLPGAEEHTDHDGVLGGAVVPVVRDARLLHDGVAGAEAEISVSPTTSVTWPRRTVT